MFESEEEITVPWPGLLHAGGTQVVAIELVRPNAGVTGAWCRCMESEPATHALGPEDSVLL